MKAIALFFLTIISFTSYAITVNEYISEVKAEDNKVEVSKSLEKNGTIKLRISIIKTFKVEGSSRISFYKWDVRTTNIAYYKLNPETNEYEFQSSASYAKIKPEIYGDHTYEPISFEDAQRIGIQNYNFRGTLEE